MTIVLVHGFLGGSPQWTDQVAGLSGVDVVTVDLPGFGQNAHLDALESIGAFADWVLTELTRQGIDRFDLLGHSMGGMVVQEMIARAPDRVRRLILYGTGATGQLPGRFETIDVSKQRARTDGSRATARRIAATWFLNHADDAAYEGCAAIAERSSLDAILTGLDAMGAWEGERRLDQIAAKTLVIWGDKDRTYPWSQTERLWRSIPGASLAVLPNCAHASHLEKPEMFNSVLRDFVLS